MGFRDFIVSDQAVEQARRLGLTGDHKQELEEMARYAAPFTHPDGNRRFDAWWLRLDEGEVTAVGLIGEQGSRPVKDEKREAKLRMRQAIVSRLKSPR